ncbi:MauE/DoxX family redox-associated membrane protein [Corynebacterium felinum]|uniref:Membrane protein YphA (DoxX/SURF4 family) n=1 Tax=Corynebacterium felinum TaxID=131318 RepID=A0ABU2B7E7_9CORY|nr:MULTISPECIES: MauE/DoxX family redox-associated membrane protein [Corynebacterium]MDF5820331.1 MauE/DoxX family redox-associated membrane protein [Corynebacterium felinum]MDO4762735.1 MauE/DoxX family redox-associated membrane protein [Corynebacterium sp.]MDR7353698.1 putative membrane protein YphA (DoxX/SURF4 family) [Corynebacterium felinum]WJY95877.1 Methylamine utilization protein MauE [Corynebacterium felinum]
MTVEDHQKQQVAGARRLSVSEIVSALCRFGLAAVWIAAGFSKLGKTVAESQAIAAYEIFTPEWSLFLAKIIGPVEIAGGVILLLGIFIRQSAKVSSWVLILFIVGIAQAWYRGLVIDCGCFGQTEITDGGMSYAWTILRDVAFLAMSVWLVYRPFTRFALHP